MAKTFYRRTAKTVIRLGRMPRLNAHADLCLCWPHKSFEPVHDKNQQKWPVHPAKTWISLGIHPVWSESSLSAWIKFGSLATLWAHSEDWSDWTDAQADLSLHWAGRSVCWFCHALADQSSMCALWVANGKNFLHEDSEDCDQTGCMARLNAQADLCLCWPHKSFEPVHDKTNKVTVRPAKTWISLGIRPVWSESSLSTWIKLGSLATQWAHSEDWSDWMDAQADLSLRWADRSFYWFCHALAD